jgi:hypothetical protein
VVFFVKDVQACERFYWRTSASCLGPLSERGAFLRCADGGHHDIFLLQRPGRQRA